ncbi:MAG: peptide chain release factor N(5)-glutamine methyltransferase [Bauldia sp.]
MTSLAGSTIGSLRRQIASRFDAAFKQDGRQGTAQLDARLLVAHALGINAGDLVMFDEQRVDPDSAARVLGFAERRVAGEPVARILGRKEFWGLEFVVSPGTLVPRPDTETVVSAALAAVDAAGQRGAPLRILDLGTGTGVILLALLRELPNARGLGVDCEAGAIATARENADYLAVGGRAELVVGDWTSDIDGVFDLIVSNPPYIPTGEIAGLPVDVRLYDPHVALDGGEDGLDAFRVTIEELSRLLVADGRTFLEMGAGQAGAVGGLATGNGWKVRLHRDLAGIDRVAELAR